MAYDELLADRIRNTLADKKVDTREMKMMGGLCFMVDEKMCIGIVKNNLMARIGPEAYESALGKKGVQPMDFTGRPMKGYVFIDPVGVDMDKDLEYWIQTCLDFNPQTVASRKKK